MQQDANRLLFYLNTLYEFTNEISEYRSVSEILQRMLRILIGTGITKGIALTHQIGETHLEVVAHENLDEPTLQDLSRQLSATNVTDGLSNIDGLIELPTVVAKPTTVGEVLAVAGLKTMCTMRVQERLIAVVVLGPLLLDNPITEHQIQLVDALVKHAQIALGNAILYQGLQQENLQLKKELGKRYQFDNIVGQSPAMQEIYERIQQAVKFPSYSVLITGESGTGKELIAGAIHHHSHRSGEFVPLNCATLPQELVESELFGHEKGAFTGADRAKAGLFEIARDGTLFLDEIAEMPYATQAKLLRVLQEKRVRRVGGLSDYPIDVNVIAATNRDMTKAIATGVFREDLYHRFVIRIETPPLRERKEDISLLVETVLEDIAKENQHPQKIISTRALKALIDYDWPGNVRELQNVLRQAFMRTEGPVIRVTDLPLSPTQYQTDTPDQLSLKDAVEEFKRHMISEALNNCAGNRRQAAQQLGISRQNLQNQMRRLKIS